MFRKFKTTTLVIIVLALGAIVALNKFYFSKKSESTFDEKFVSIDSSRVTKIIIHPASEKGKEIRLIRDGRGWELQNDQVKTRADSNAVKSLLTSFLDIRSISLGGADQSTWKELQTDDSTGSRIRFEIGDDEAHELVVGKFGYNPASRSGVTYIRHADQEQVYVIDGFLSFAVNQGFNAWRVKTFVTGNKDQWTTLTFNYPGDSSFVLAKQNFGWTLNGEPTDSAKTGQFLNSLAAIQSNSFVDGYTPSSTAAYTLTIVGNNQPAPLTISAYPGDTVQKFILHSSANPEAYFSEGQNNIMGRLFVGKSSLK